MNHGYKICVVGLGYIGLPTAALLAESGHEVVGVDIVDRVVEQINMGRVHIEEEGLQNIVEKVVKSGNLKASKTLEAADIFCVCVPTPISDDSEPKPDLRAVFDAVDNISVFLQRNNYLIIESTLPVGATDSIANRLALKGVETSGVQIAYCPERVLPGKIMQELKENNRVVGGVTDEATEKISAFLSEIIDGNVFKTNARTAEMCKLAENSFRDVNIAFANELSMLSQNSGIEIKELISLANKHPRVNILSPGPGVGGHCIAVDPWFIVAENPQNAKLIKTARQVNDHKPIWVIEQVKKAISSLQVRIKRKPLLGCLGVTFKPNVDDLRESPSLEIVVKLTKLGFDVKVFDPHVVPNRAPELEFVAEEQLLNNSDFVICLVKHAEFLKLNLEKHKKNKTIMDFCGLLS